jgi:hypothetical protein
MQHLMEDDIYSLLLWDFSGHCLISWFKVYFSGSMSHVFRNTRFKSWPGLAILRLFFLWFLMPLLVMFPHYISFVMTTSTADTAILCNHAVEIKLVRNVTFEQDYVHLSKITIHWSTVRSHWFVIMPWSKNWHRAASPWCRIYNCHWLDVDLQVSVTF